MKMPIQYYNNTALWDGTAPAITVMVEGAARGEHGQRRGG